MKGMKVTDGHPVYQYNTPCFNEVESRVYWFHLVHLSVRPYDMFLNASTWIMSEHYKILFQLWLTDNE